MGEEADSILYSFGLSDDDRNKYNTVSNKFEAHFVKQRNPIHERRSLICVDRKKGNCGFIHNVALPASKTLQLLGFT